MGDRTATFPITDPLLMFAIEMSKFSFVVFVTFMFQQLKTYLVSGSLLGSYAGTQDLYISLAGGCQDYSEISAV